MLEQIRLRPTWVRGKAKLEGNEIVLAEGTTEEYPAFDPEHSERLLLDLGNLAQLGQIAAGEEYLEFRLADKSRALEFAEIHGLLWHGPKQMGTGEFRESLQDWFAAGVGLSISTATYSAIRQSQDSRSAEPIRRYLRTLRDGRLFAHLRLSDDDNELLNYACLQLAEKVSRGMTDCTPTLMVARDFPEDGTRAGELRFGGFGIGNDAGSLVGAAYYQLSLLIANKRWVITCEECGELMIPEDPRRRFHKKCGNRKRQRERRERLKHLAAE